MFNPRQFRDKLEPALWVLLLGLLLSFIAKWSLDLMVYPSRRALETRGVLVQSRLTHEKEMEIPIGDGPSRPIDHFEFDFLVGGKPQNIKWTIDSMFRWTYHHMFDTDGLTESFCESDRPHASHSIEGIVLRVLPDNPKTFDIPDYPPRTSIWGLLDDLHTVTFGLWAVYLAGVLTIGAIALLLMLFCSILDRIFPSPPTGGGLHPI